MTRGGRNLGYLSKIILKIVITDNRHAVESWRHFVAEVDEIQHDDEDCAGVYDELNLALGSEPKGDQRQKHDSLKYTREN